MAFKRGRFLVNVIMVPHCVPLGVHSEQVHTALGIIVVAQLGHYLSNDSVVCLTYRIMLLNLKL